MLENKDLPMNMNARTSITDSILLLTCVRCVLSLSIRTQMYIEALTSKTRPQKILVCTIYYPGVDNVPSWANDALGALGYNQNPAKLQLLIRKVFEEATRYVRYSVHPRFRCNTLNEPVQSKAQFV